LSSTGRIDAFTSGRNNLAAFLIGTRLIAAARCGQAANTPHRVRLFLEVERLVALLEIRSRCDSARRFIGDV
jgi:hypothetical protein